MYTSNITYVTHIFCKHNYLISAQPLKVSGGCRHHCLRRWRGGWGAFPTRGTGLALRVPWRSVESWGPGGNQLAIVGLLKKNYDFGWFCGLVRMDPQLKTLF